MSETAVVAESTPAPVMDVARGPLVNMTPEQRTEFRKTGEVPTTGDAASSSEAKPSKGEAESAGASETPQVQERTEPKKRGQTAEERIAELEASRAKLEATIEKIRKGAGRETKTEAESSPVKPVQQAQYTRPKPTAEDKKEDGTPKYDTYEDFVEELADWKTEQREAKSKREAVEKETVAKAQAKVEEAKGRYKDFAEVVGPAYEAIVDDAEVSPVVKRMLDDSDVFADLMYTIGTSKEELASFVKMSKENPGKAIRYIALTESLIAEELEGKKAAPAEVVPVKPKTQAPRPPSEAGGRAATPPDALEAAVQAGDYRAAKAEMNRKALAKLKG